MLNNRIIASFAFTISDRINYQNKNILHFYPHIYPDYNSSY